VILFHVCVFEGAWGYSLFSELEIIGDGRRVPIERDLYFEPGSFSGIIVRTIGRTEAGPEVDQEGLWRAGMQTTRSGFVTRS
jgi:hypothetical protein